MATMPSWQSKGIFDPRVEREYKEIKGQDILASEPLSLTEELEKQVTEPTSDGRPENMVKDTNDMLHMVQESTLQDAEKRVSFATVVVTENTHKKVNFWKVEEDVARVDDVLENGPWMIRQVPIILNTWYPLTSLTKENHSSVPIWVKMHDVPTFTDDGLSFIASKTRNPLMLDSYTSTMCNKSWGRSSYARTMIEVHANVELKESILVAVPKLEGNGYTYGSHQGEMDGFQLVKDRNAGRKTTYKSYGVKTKKNLVYRPVSKDNVSSSPKTNMASSSKQQGKQPIITANSFSALVDEDINEANIEDWKTVGSSKYVDLESKKKGTVDLDSDDDVENCYDETAGFMENDMMVQRGQALPYGMVPIIANAHSWNIRVDIGILERVFSKVCSKWEWTSNASHCRKGSRIIKGWNDEAVDVTVLDCSSRVILRD
ncbi:polyadenylate-binding protein 2-like protein [Tanacetum coccineum]